MTHINDETNDQPAHASAGQPQPHHNGDYEKLHSTAEDVKRNHDESGPEETPASSKELEAEVAKLQSDVAEWQDKYMRLAAESENIRRRHEKERADLLKYGTENLIKELLPILDGFDKAFANLQSTPEVASFVNGFSLLQKQLNEILERKGLKAIPSEGVPFDPNLHQAIQRVESDDVTEDTVHQEYARGYTLNERLVRPAMVSVCVPSGKSEG